MVRTPPAARLAIAALPRLLFAGRFASIDQVPFHRHDGLELVHLTAGECRIDVAGRELEGTTGTVFVLPAAIEHNQRNRGHVRTTYLVLSAPALTFAPEARAVRLEPGDRCAAWIEDLCQLHHDARTAGAGVAGGLLLAVLERLNELEHRQGAAQAMPAPLARAVRYLEARRLDALRVAEVARHAGVSASHLTALFRARFACGPLKYQLRLKLQLAQKLLANSYLGVAEVGAACGFGDPNYFSRIFRAHHGSPPATWRRHALPKPGS